MLPLLGFYLAVEVSSRARIASAQTIDTVTETAMVETEEEAADIPPPVTADENLDGVSLRERKMAKIKSANQQENDSDEEVEELVTVRGNSRKCTHR